MKYHAEHVDLYREFLLAEESSSQAGTNIMLETKEEVLALTVKLTFISKACSKLMTALTTLEGTYLLTAVSAHSIREDQESYLWTIKGPVGYVEWICLRSTDSGPVLCVSLCFLIPVWKLKYVKLAVGTLFCQYLTSLTKPLSTCLRNTYLRTAQEEGREITLSISVVLLDLLEQIQ